MGDDYVQERCVPHWFGMGEGGYKLFHGTTKDKRSSKNPDVAQLYK